MIRLDMSTTASQITSLKQHFCCVSSRDWGYQRPKPLSPSSLIDFFMLFHKNMSVLVVMAKGEIPVIVAGTDWSQFRFLKVLVDSSSFILLYKFSIFTSIQCPGVARFKKKESRPKNNLTFIYKIYWHPICCQRQNRC